MTKPDFEEEKKLWEKGFDFVIGIDEVGRGAFAGPLVVGAVLFKRNTSIKLLNGVNDSKLLKPLTRQKLSKIISQNCLCSQITSIPVSKINKVGVGKATQIGFRKLISDVIGLLEIGYLKFDIPKRRYFVLVDGFHVKYIKGIGLKNQKAIIKGDQKSISIASASIIAKVYRDKIMKNLNKKYPVYNFGKNKGYGTKFHQKALKKYGLSKIHRKSFNLQKITTSA